MEIEIPKEFYELLLKEASATGSTVEQIVELAFRKIIERGKENAKQ